MTTVACKFKDREIAVDSRCTAGSLIANDKVDKVAKKDGVTFIACGSVSDIELLVNGYPYGFDADISLEAQAFIIDEGKLYMGRVSEGVYKLDPITFDSTLGSGGDFALAAMDFGKSAKEAVKYAATRDCATGGRIRVVKF